MTKSSSQDSKHHPSPRAWSDRSEIDPEHDQRGDSARSPVGSKRTVRRSTAERRKEIAAVTLLLMARFGLQGTTVSRIAEEVGMEAPSLYAHFSGRQGMLLAAIDALFERVAHSLEVSSNPNMLERLREISSAHASYMTGEFEGFVIPVYEFMTAPRESGLSDVVGARQRETIRTLADMVEEGKRQGSIRDDIDSYLAAWELMMCYWAEDVSQLMGIDEYLSDGHSARILDLVLRDMEPRRNQS